MFDFIILYLIFYHLVFDFYHLIFDIYHLVFDFYHLVCLILSFGINILIFINFLQCIVSISV